MRLLLVVLLVGGFAACFAALVDQTEQSSPRQAAAARCGEAVGVPCPSRATAD